jgi:hypothetical protein
MKTEKHDWYAQMVRKLQINGVHQLTKHYQRDPKLITEEELETYFLYRSNNRVLKRVTMFYSIILEINS